MEKAFSKQFLRIKVKQHLHRGQQALLIHVTDVSNKVKTKLQKIQAREKRQEKKQAQSYKSTISHELRAPLESSSQIIADIIQKLKADP